jgi:hypothetical protein
MAPAANAYPVLWAVQRDGVVRPRTARDVCIASAAAGAIAAFASDRRQGSPANTLASFIVEVPDPVRVKLRIPHSALASDSGALPSETELEAAYAQVDERGRAFEQALENAGVPEGERRDAGFMCHCLHKFKVDFIDGRVAGLTARHVEAFLLEHYPRKVSASPDLVKRTPEMLDRYFVWLAESGLDSAVNVARLRDRLARVEDEFFEIAGDPALFGPAKTVVMAMEKAGVDPSDEKALAAFIADYNRNLPGVPGGRRARNHGSAKARTSAPTRAPAPKRWSTAADRPTPAPMDACPCGSGKRYKRCCMPR